jgi:hypothetical protein
MRIKNERAAYGSIWFGKGSYLSALPDTDSKLDIVFTPQRNDWNGNTSIQLKIRDLAVSA